MVMSASGFACLVFVMRHASFFFVSIIGIRPGRVSYHSPGPSPRFKGREGGKILEEALLLLLLGGGY